MVVPFSTGKTIGIFYGIPMGNFCKGCPCPEGVAAHKQSAWDTPVVKQKGKC